MSKQLKFLQVTTLLRSFVDPIKVPMKRYDELLAPHDAHARSDLVRSFEALLSGEVKIDFEIAKVKVGRQVFRRQTKKKVRK